MFSPTPYIYIEVTTCPYLRKNVTIKSLIRHPTLICSFNEISICYFNSLLFNLSLFTNSLFTNSLFNLLLFNTQLINNSLFNSSLFNDSLFNDSSFNNCYLTVCYFLLWFLRSLWLSEKGVTQLPTYPYLRKNVTIKSLIRHPTFRVCQFNVNGASHLSCQKPNSFPFWVSFLTFTCYCFRKITSQIKNVLISLNP
jgi:hypothetical protein